MEYPGSKLTKPWRNLILAAFIVIFLVASPLTILYTTGYRLDVAVGIVRQVGILSVDGETSGATIKLNGLQQPGHMPMRLNTLLPGTYQLTISAPNYHPWQQNITINPKETTYVKDVDLPRIAAPQKISSSTDLTIAIMPALKTIAYTERASEGTAIVFYRLDTSSTLVATTTRQPVQRLHISPHEELLSIEADTKAPFFIETKTLRTYVTESTSSFPFRWDARGQDTQIYIKKHDSISRYDIPSRTISESARIQAFVDWFPYQGTVWTLDVSEFNSSTLAIKNASRGIFSGNEGEWNRALSSWGRGTDWSFLDMRDDLAFLKKTTGDEVAVIGRKKIATLPAYTFSRAPRGQGALLRGSSEVWRLMQNSDPVLVYRSSEPLVAANTMNETDLYLFATRHRLFAYQDFYGIATELAEDVVIRWANAIPSARTIIFSGSYRGEDGLWRLVY